MNKFAILTIISLTITASKTAVNPALICAEDIRVTFDDSLQLVASFLKGPLSPSLPIVKHLLGSVTKYLGDCEDIHTDLTRFDICVDKMTGLQPILRRLVDDVIRGRVTESFGDVSQFIAFVSQELVPCFKQHA